jgi:perosamine synthetase
MDYRTFDPAGCNFPKPRVPVLPTLGLRSLLLRSQTDASKLTTATNAWFYSRGRYAMTEAYRLSGVGPGSTLMAPAYHCRTMLDPAIRLGAKVALYPLRADLQPDLDGVLACLHACTAPPTALVLTHYFGFAQPLDALMEFCQNHGIALIEDCSHCLFLPGSATGVGLRGHYCVSSPYKFFPIEDGGVLWANNSADLPSQQTNPPGVALEFKAVARSLQRALESLRQPATELPTQPVESGSAGLTGTDLQNSTEKTSKQYAIAAEKIRCLAISRWMMCHTDTNRMTARRRSNYRDWANAVAGLPNCRALLPDLPDNCVPYMFPLEIQQPDVHFLALKRLAVPVGRWDDMAISTCAVASAYRRNLLHLPCHQELTEDQLNWLISTVVRVMSDNATPSKS